VSKKKRNRANRRPRRTDQTPEPRDRLPKTKRDFPTLSDPRVQLVLILFLIFVVYIPSLFVPWYFDDYIAVVDNRNLRSAEGIRFILRNFIHRSVVQLTYALDWHISDGLGLYQSRTEGGRPGYQSTFVYHLSSVVYHLLTVAGVFLLTRELLRLLDHGDDKKNTHRSYLPALVALLYGIHPVNTEAATYLSGRASVLATIEYVYGVLCLLIASERFGFLRERLGARSTKDYVIGSLGALGFVLCFVLGIGTKEIIVTMPAVGGLILAWLIVRRRSLRTAAIRLVPAVLFLGILLIGFFVYRLRTLGGDATGQNPDSESWFADLLHRVAGVEEAKVRPWWVNLLSQIGVIGLYYIPRQLCLRPLCIDPDVPQIETFGHPHLIGGLLILVGLIGLGILFARRQPLIPLGIAWYFISLAPTSSVIPLNDLAAERHVYLPNIGFMLAVVALGRFLWERINARTRNPHLFWKPTTIVIGCLCLFLSVATAQRNNLYADKIEFWRDTVENSPNKARTHFHLAKEYMDADRMWDAAKELNAALEIDPYLPDAANNLGIIYMVNRQDYDKASKIFERCIQLWPEWEKPWINLGTCYLKAARKVMKGQETPEKREQAEEWFRKAWELSRRWLERAPNSRDARILVANTLHLQGRINEAEQCYLEILEKYGESISVLDNLAAIASKKGDQEALAEYKAKAEAFLKSQEFKPWEVHGKRDTLRAD